MNKYLLSILIAATAGIFSVKAQDDGGGSLPAAFDKGGVGVSGGSMLFYGDLAGYNVLPRLDHFDNTFRTGYRFFVKRKVKWGLGGRLGFTKGKLQGGHRNGRGAQHLSFKTDLMSLNLSANYDLVRLLYRKKDISKRRFYADLNVGIGLLWFRSYSVRTELGGVYDYYGYTETDITQDRNQKILLDRDKKIMKMSIPVGVDLGYRINHKTDINLNIALVNTTTDKLDTFVRDWTARDKFGYFGIGVTYNFNRSESDIPERKKKEEEEEDQASASSSDSGDISDIDLSGASSEKKGLLKRMFKSESSDIEDKELLKIKLKLFETQLKLFEMQYLLQSQD